MSESKNRDDRIAQWRADVLRTLDEAADLVSRGKKRYDTDAALPLAFEALCNRVGDLAKKLVDADLVTHSAPVWSAAARNRDMIVHHYHRIDRDLLWNTVAEKFAELRTELDR